MVVGFRRVAPDLSASEVVGERALAVGIDAVLVGLCSVALAVGVGSPLGGVPVALALAPLLWAAYSVGGVGTWGQTPGKHLAGVVVVDARGGVPTYRAAAVRELLRVADVALVGLAPLRRTDRRRRLGDRVAETVVVRARREERRL